MIILRDKEEESLWLDYYLDHISLSSFNSDTVDIKRRIIEISEEADLIVELYQKRRQYN